MHLSSADVIQSPKGCFDDAEVRVYQVEVLVLLYGHLKVACRPAFVACVCLDGLLRRMWLPNWDWFDPQRAM